MNISKEEIFYWLIVTLILGIGFDYIYRDFVTSQTYTFIKELMTFVLTVTGLVIANGGLFTWQKQIEYSKKDAVVNNLHLSLLKLRDAIKHVRNPGIFPSEKQKAEQYFKSKYPENIELVEDNSYVYEMRWEEISKALTEMEASLLNAEMLWGAEIRKLVKPLYGKISELNITLKQNFNPTLRTKDFMEIHDVMYDKSDWINDIEDSFSGHVNTNIEKVVVFMKKKITE